MQHLRLLKRYSVHLLIAMLGWNCHGKGVGYFALPKDSLSVSFSKKYPGVSAENLNKFTQHLTQQYALLTRGYAHQYISNFPKELACIVANYACLTYSPHITLPINHQVAQLHFLKEICLSQLTLPVLRLQWIGIEKLKLDNCTIQQLLLKSCLFNELHIKEPQKMQLYLDQVTLGIFNLGEANLQTMLKVNHSKIGVLTFHHTELSKATLNNCSIYQLHAISEVTLHHLSLSNCQVESMSLGEEATLIKPRFLHTTLKNAQIDPQALIINPSYTPTALPVIEEHAVHETVGQFIRHFCNSFCLCYTEDCNKHDCITHCYSLACFPIVLCSYCFIYHCNHPRCCSLCCHALCNKLQLNHQKTS